MTITHHTGVALDTATTGSATTDGPAIRCRLTPEQLAVVDADQRAHLSFAQSPDAPEGEHLVRRSLELLEPYGWHHLRLVTWRQALPGTVAHLVVGPGGVVVIDERIWTGPIYIEAGTGVLRHHGFPCDRETAALGDAVALLSALLPPRFRMAVTGVLCVTPRDLPAQRVDGVHLVGRLHLGGFLAGLVERLSPIEVHQVIHALTVAFDGPMPTPTPDAVPTQRPAPDSRSIAPEPAAYFTRTLTPADPVPTVGAARVWRSAGVRVAFALLVGLLTYQNSHEIAVAVDGWLGGEGTSVVAEG